MKILVAIANYGRKNRHYIETLLSSYQDMEYRVGIVVLSNEPKDFGSEIEVRVGLPSANPWSLPFAHKSLFAERINDYDLFIYSEDDTLITQKNIEAFLESVRILPQTEIPGFLRYESDRDGNRYISSAHGSFHWRPESAKTVATHTFAQFTNAHSACFILTRPHLESAIASGGFLLPPYEGDYDMLCTAATDPYTRCGLTKVINISRIEDFLLPHLPNKYLGTMGTPYSTFQVQVEALKQIASGARSPLTAFTGPTLPNNSPWAKSYYEPCNKELINLIPKDVGSILSLGMGAGATECELVRRGFKVTAIPLDSVVSAAAEQDGVAMVHCEVKRGPEIVRSRRFDCVLIQNSTLFAQESAGFAFTAFFASEHARLCSNYGAKFRKYSDHSQASLWSARLSAPQLIRSKPSYPNYVGQATSLVEIFQSERSTSSEKSRQH